MRLSQLQKGSATQVVKEYYEEDGGASIEDIKDAILHRFRMNPDMLGQCLQACGGIDKFMQHVEDEASFHEGAEELGSSDVSIMVRDVCRACGVNEGKSPHKKGTEAYRKHMAAMHAESKQVNEGVLDTEDEDGFMAKAQLYHMAKYAADLHGMIQDRDNLEPWVQAKLTKAQDYLSVVKHYLEYQMVKQQLATPEMPDVDESLTYAIAKQAHDHHKKTGELPSHVDVDGKKMPVRMKHDDIKKIVDWVNYAQVDEDASSWWDRIKQGVTKYLAPTPLGRGTMPGPLPPAPDPVPEPEPAPRPDMPSAPAPAPGPDMAPAPDSAPRPRMKKTLPRAIEV